ncbi:MAG: efflux RND transporter permease subunit [Bacillota bacterium]
MIKTFINRPVFTTMLVLLLVVFGIYSYPKLGVDTMPNVEIPVVLVQVTYQGAGSEEMENLIAKPLENQVSAISGIKSIKSVSSEGLAMIIVEFDLGVDVKFAENDVREKVALARKRLPDQADEPVISRYDPNSQPILYYALSSETMSLGELNRFGEDYIKDQLQRLSGVADVQIRGGQNREIHVYINTDKLELYKIPLSKITAALDGMNVNVPGGSVKEKGTRINIRTTGRFKSVDDIRDIVISSADNSIINLGDVADVVDGWEEPTYRAENEKRPCIILQVQKQSGSNTVAVSDVVNAAMKKIEQTEFRKGMKLTTLIDSTKYVRDSVHDVWVSIIWGGLLAILVTFAFLGSIRATIISAIAIPTSLIATFFLMNSMGFTLNNMSLMGLSLAVGILIDDAIVVIENIHRHIENGEQPQLAALNGTNQIALAVLATTFSLLAVFVPVGTMTGVVGQFFREFGLTIAFAVAFSLFVAFSLTPMLSAYWLTAHDPNEKTNFIMRGLKVFLRWFEQAFELTREFYLDSLRLALKHSKKVIVVAILILLASFVLFKYVGFEFMPKNDSSMFRVKIEAPAGTSLEQTTKYAQPLVDEIMKLPELETTGLMIQNESQGTIMVKLKSRTDRPKVLVNGTKKVRSQFEIMDSLRDNFTKNPNLKTTMLISSSAGGGDARPVQIGIRGPELNKLDEFSQKLMEELRKVPGTTDISSSSGLPEPEIIIHPKPWRMSELGLDNAKIGAFVNGAFIGLKTVNNYNVGDNEFTIRIQLDPLKRLSPDQISNLKIPAGNGQFVTLGEIADIKISSGPTQINREDKERQITVYSDVAGVTPDVIMTKAEEIIKSMNLPAEYWYKFVGQTDTQKEAFGGIVQALALAIVLIYMVLAAQFESFVHPLTIMVSLPFSLIGVIIALLASGITFNLMSMIGIIMLMGLVTKNAILLIDFANQRRADGVSITEAAIEAGSTRLRPILMTTLAMIFGMIPTAIGFGESAEFRQAMGISIIGGLITSTILTLVLVPIVYIKLDALSQKLLGKKS